MRALIVLARREHAMLARRHDRALRDHQLALAAGCVDIARPRAATSISSTPSIVPSSRATSSAAPTATTSSGFAITLGFAAGDARELAAHRRHPRHAADEQDLLDLLALATAPAQRLA